MNKEARVLMVQGTTSDAGKTTLVAGLCRVLAQAGYSVAPFKAWNLSLNSAVTADGEEMGRGQMVQAEASQTLAMADMNPVLVKPQPNGIWQTVIQGKVTSAEELQAYRQHPDGLFSVIKQSLQTLRSQYDIVVIEGSGAPAELNLMQYDIANMRVAKHAQAPVLMVANIDPQGAHASLYGTTLMLQKRDPEGAKLIKGFVVNKFRGDPSVLAENNAFLSEETGIPVIGVLPFIEKLQMDDEDSYALRPGRYEKPGAVLEVVIPLFPTLQNTDDFKILFNEPGINVRMIDGNQDFGSPDLVILGGSKGTISDLRWLEQTGIAGAIKNYASQKGAVLCICGGQQMAGDLLVDPYSVESTEKEVVGLGLLPLSTTFEKEKVLRQVKKRVNTDIGLLAGTKGMEVSGYEIHMGRSTTGEKEVTSSLAEEGWVLGTYVHGLLKNHELRRKMLENLASRKGVQLPNPLMSTIDPYDLLAQNIRDNLDLTQIRRILRL